MDRQEKDRDIGFAGRVRQSDLDDLANARVEEGPKPPQVILKLSPNRMELELELIPSGIQTLPAEVSDVMKAIADIGVVFGINEERIKRMCDENNYHHSLPVARGRREEVGADGYITYHISTDNSLKPKEREDGSVDYRDLGLIQNVVKGQVLAEIHPEKKGTDGMDVLGTVLEGRMGKKPPNVQGKNTQVAADGVRLLAVTDGDAKVKSGVVEVVNVFKVNGNVDNATGDIDFIGDVQVMGDVMSGFKVISGGSIMVKGTVEGAELRAAGDIVVNAGINGMNNGYIEAGGNIKCRYIQGARIKAEENIYADAIMYCNIECSGNLELSGQKGGLIGGKAILKGNLIAGSIGTSSHTTTQIIVQTEDHRLIEEKEEIEERQKEIDAEELKLTQLINRVTEAQNKGIKNPEFDNAKDTATSQIRNIRMERMKLSVRLQEVEQEQLRQSQESSGYIQCKGRIHSGVQISFGPLNMVVQNSFVYSRISLINNEISVSPLS